MGLLMRRLLTTICAVLVSSIGAIAAPVPPVKPENLNQACDHGQTESQCMVCNMYFEARNQSDKGVIAVGLVTLNRMHSSMFPASVCDIVWEKHKSLSTGKMVSQYSWTTGITHATMQNKDEVRRINRLLDQVLHMEATGQNKIVSTDTMWYHTTEVHPIWSRDMKTVAHIGDHIFFSYSD